MIRCFVGRYLNIGYIIGSEAGTAVLGMPFLSQGQGPITGEQKGKLLHFLEVQLMPEVESAALRMSAGLVTSLIGDIQNIAGLEQQRVAEKLRNIRIVMQNELTERWFIGLSQDVVEIFDRPEPFFREGFAAFPAAQDDMCSACRTYALDQGTACVFHLMRIAELGLRSLARTLKVQISHKGKFCPLEYGEWDKIITAIKNKIDPIRKLPAGPNRQAKLEFYSDAADHCTFMKDVWRNNVAHTRKPYSKSESLTVLERVRDFMHFLALGRPLNKP